MVGVVLECRFDQASPVDPCSATAKAKGAQGREPACSPCLVQAQSRWLATRACPYFLIHRSRRIEVRHDVFQLAPDFRRSSRNRRRSVRLNAAPVERDREVVFEIARLEDRVLAPLYLALHHLSDMVEYLENTDHTVPARACLTAQGIEEMGGEYAVAGV